MDREDWKKYMVCKTCGSELNFTNIKRLLDIDFKREGFYCKTCFPEAEGKLKEERFVEEYNGNKIYCKDGNYVPYWGCGYYFLSLDDAKRRIDLATQGIGVYVS